MTAIAAQCRVAPPAHRMSPTPSRARGKTNHRQRTGSTTCAHFVRCSTRRSRNTRAAARLSKAAISTAGRSPPIFALNTPIAQLPAIPEPRPIGRKPTTNIAGGARSSRGTAGLPTSLTLWLKRGSSEVLKASIFDGYRLGPAHAAPSMTLSLPLRRVVDGYWRLSLEAV